MPRARAFYEGVLGLKPTMEADGGLWMEYTIGHSTFGIGCFGDAWKPSSDGTCIAFEVDNLDAELSQIKAKGVLFAMDVAETPICRFALVYDPDGNKIMIHKRKES
jgi:predicted enzyme related to lactoylglutathione lyase